jgi:hypothetical protein
MLETASVSRSGHLPIVRSLNMFLNYKKGPLNANADLMITHPDL